MLNKSEDLGKTAHPLSILMDKPALRKKKQFLVANLLASEDILRGGNRSEQTGNVSCLTESPCGGVLKPDG